MRRARGVIGAALLLIPSVAHAAWTPTAPGGGGFFTHSGAGPSGIVIVTADLAGVYRSTDRGATWTCVGAASGLTKTHASCVAFDPADSAIIYVGTEDGVFRSADEGRTYSPALPGGYVPWIAPFGKDPRVVYALRHPTYNDTTHVEIWKSETRGASWSQVGARGLPAKGRGVKLLVAPGDPAHLYLLMNPEKLVPSKSLGYQLYESQDAGASWRDMKGDPARGGMCAECRPLDVAVDPAVSDSLWATAADDPSLTRGHVYFGAGGTWRPCLDVTGALIVRRGGPARASEVYVVNVETDPGTSGAGFWRSLDAGRTWSRVSDGGTWDRGWSGSTAWAFGKGFCVAKTLGVDLCDDRVWYWTTAQFVHRTTDAGASFTNLYTRSSSPGRWSSTGINNSNVASVSISGASLYSGWWDMGIWRSDTSAVGWEPCNDAAHTGAWKGEGGNCLDILADPERPAFVWATQGEKKPDQLIYSSTSASRDGWRGATGLPKGAFLYGLALDPRSPGSRRTLFVTAGGALYRSADDGHSFAAPCTKCPPQSSPLRVVAARGILVLAGGEGGLWRSLDGGATFARLDPHKFPERGTPGTLKQLKWDGPHAILIASDDTVFVAARGTGGGVYRTANAQAPAPTWTCVWSDVDAMSIHRAANGFLYAGSSRQTQASGVPGSRGLFRSTDGGGSFCSVTATGAGSCDRATTAAPWPFAFPIATTAGGTVFFGSTGQGFYKGGP